MYVIMVDDDILYHPLLVNEGRAVTSATVDVELDKTGSATITIPVNNVMYDSINKMKSMIQVLSKSKYPALILFQKFQIIINFNIQTLPKIS